MSVAQDTMAELEGLGFGCVWVWGTLEQIVSRVTTHLDAGANHVAVQVLPADPRGLPIAQWRELATIIPSL